MEKFDRILLRAGIIGLMLWGVWSLAGGRTFAELLINAQQRAMMLQTELEKCQGGKK